jgi:hypothetical protein
VPQQPRVKSTAAQADLAMTYAAYAKHCLKVSAILADRESRLIHREMAADWLRLADQAAHYSVRSPAIKASRAVL